MRPTVRSASYQSPSERHHEPLGRRPTALLLALLVHFLVILMLLTLAPPLALLEKVAPALKTLRLLPADESRVAPKPAPRGKTAKAKRTGGGAPPRAPAAPAKPSVTTPTPPPNMIVLTRNDFAAADISKMVAPPAKAGAGTGTGEDSGSAVGPGEGPGGARLYNAEWYVEPTHAEMAYYLPTTGPRVGWGLIACRTIENYHVDDCRQLGESPPGSGLSRALRQAAWQFRVRPPRIGGKPMIGAWVRIRFDFTEAKKE